MLMTMTVFLPACNSYSARVRSNWARVGGPAVCTGVHHVQAAARVGRLVACALMEDRVRAAADTLFSTLDEDGDGFISSMEMTNHFAKLGFQEKNIEHVFDLLDVNKDGEISPGELRDTFARLNDAALLQVLGLGESESDHIFTAIDANGDGEITRTELAAFLERQGHPASIADSIFDTLDENLDGAISRDELHDGYMSYSGLRQLLVANGS